MGVLTKTQVKIKKRGTTSLMSLIQSHLPLVHLLSRVKQTMCCSIKRIYKTVGTRLCLSTCQHLSSKKCPASTVELNRTVCLTSSFGHLPEQHGSSNESTKRPAGEINQICCTTCHGSLAGLSYLFYDSFLKLSESRDLQL